MDKLKRKNNIEDKKDKDRKYDGSKDDEKLDFLNERVVRDIRKDLVKYIRLVLIIALFISITALVIFVGLKSDIKTLSNKIEEKNVTTISGAGQDHDGNKNDGETIMNSDGQGNKEHRNVLTPEEAYRSVVVIENITEDDGNSKSITGVVVAKNEDVYILAYSSELAEKEKVNVYFDGVKTEGEVKKAVSDYKLTVIGVSGDVIREQLGKYVITDDKESGQYEEDSMIAENEERIYDKMYQEEVIQKDMAQKHSSQEDTLQKETLQKDIEQEDIEQGDIGQEDILQQMIVTATMCTKEEFGKSEMITLIGNPINNKNIIEKGRLTLTENTVSILDARLKLATTDINAVKDENGFVFNEEGILLGAAITDEFSGKVSVIDISNLKNYIDRMLSNKRIPYIGIYGKEVTDEVIEKIDRDMPHGIYISNTKDNSPAYRAGIMNGDVIVAIEGTDIYSFEEYLSVLDSCQPRQGVDVTVMRKGKEGYKKIEYDVTIGELN